ncbi:hypothetical protein C8J57DRAFT_1392412 [Mycena rebaudengoi]|nr:hypothetical protein C8J57DRAFT_1392412 [Mycena rebaudengoi]
MQIVRVAEPARPDDSVFRSIGQSIRARVVNILRKRAPEIDLAIDDTLEDLSIQLRHPSDTSQMHCEASMMALVAQRDPGLITSETASLWPIGASQECCWTCRKLGELLAHDGLSFAIGGTHDIGWVPPTGLPLKVLEGLRDALLNAYARICEAELGPRRISLATQLRATSLLFMF